MNVRTTRTMPPRGRRLRAIVAMLGLAASMAVGQFLLPGTAHAGCIGPGLEAENVLNVNGTEWASETPISGTCNQNHAYRAMIQSHRSGWRVSFWEQNDGIWTGHFGAYNQTAVEINFNDSNSFSYIHLCVDNGTTWRCGLGDTFTQSSGVTHNHYVVSLGF